MIADAPPPPEKGPQAPAMDLEKPMPAFSPTLFSLPAVADPPPPLRELEPKTPAEKEAEDAPCASVSSSSGSATPSSASDEDDVRAPPPPAAPAAAHASASDEAADASASDEDDAPPPAALPAATKSPQKIPKPRGRAPRAGDGPPATWDPDRGRWTNGHAPPDDRAWREREARLLDLAGPPAESSDDEETLDVMRQRSRQDAPRDDDVESLEDVESRFLGGRSRPPSDDKAESESEADEAPPAMAALLAAAPDPDAEANPEKTGRWTNEEHTRFLRGLELFGKKWSKVADVVGSRTTIQVRSHAQKYLKKFEGAESSDDDETLDVMRRKGRKQLEEQDRVAQRSRDDGREKAAQARARRDLERQEEEEAAKRLVGTKRPLHERDDDEVRCALCLDALGGGATLLSCGHAFHAGCFSMPSSLGRARCPVCQQSGSRAFSAEFEAGASVEARVGATWVPGVVARCVEGGYSIDVDGTCNEVHARDVRARRAPCDADVKDAAAALLATKEDPVVPASHCVTAETPSDETLRWLDGFETRRWVERLVRSIDDSSTPKDEYSELSNSQLRVLMRKNGIGRGSYDTRSDFVKKLKKHGVPAKEEVAEVVVKPLLLDTSKVRVGANVEKRFPGYGIYKGSIVSVEGDDVLVKWDDGDEITWTLREAARRVVKGFRKNVKPAKKKAERRAPAERPALVDVDDLVARDVRLERTQKPRQARFERFAAARTAKEFLSLGGQKKDLRYDVSNGFLRVVDDEGSLPVRFASDAGALRVAAVAVPPAGSRVAVRFSDGADYAGTVARALDANRALVAYDDGSREPVRFLDPDVRVTRVGPADAADESGDEAPARHWVTGYGWKPGPKPDETLSRAARMALGAPPATEPGCSEFLPRLPKGRFGCPAGCARTFDHAPAAAAHGKACTGEDALPRRPPRPLADAGKRFPCPAGCARSFDHAPAAAAHGKTCSGCGAAPDASADWASTARRLLTEIRGERDRNRYANLEELRPALTRCGFSGTPPPWRAGYCGVSTPAHFPESSRIRSLAQLVNYLEGALAKEGEPRPAAPRAPAEPDDAIRDEFSLLSSSQLRQAMQARGIGRGAYDAPLEFRRKLRAHEAAHPKRKAEAESDAEDGPSAKRARDESESEVDEDAFAVGTRVEARWRKKWYPASIYAIYERGAAYEIEWLDDGRFNRVSAAAVRLTKAAKPKAARKMSTDDESAPASPRSVLPGKRGRAQSSPDDEEVLPAKKVRGPPEAGQREVDEEPVAAQEFAVGVPVEAKWGGRFFPAAVHRFDRGRYEVVWDDKSTYNWVAAKCVRARAAK